MSLLVSVHSVPQFDPTGLFWIILIFHSDTEATASCNQGYIVCIIQSQTPKSQKNIHVATYPSLIAGFIMSKYKLCNNSHLHKQNNPPKKNFSGFFIALHLQLYSRGSPTGREPAQILICSFGKL